MTSRLGAHPPPTGGKKRDSFCCERLSTQRCGGADAGDAASSYPRKQLHQPLSLFSVIQPLLTPNLCPTKQFSCSAKTQLQTTYRLRDLLVKGRREEVHRSVSRLEESYLSDKGWQLYQSPTKKLALVRIYNATV